MLRWLAKRRRNRRAIEYIKLFPQDEPAAFGILSIVEMFGVKGKTARVVAQMIAGREVPDSEWAEVGYRWQRAWDYIFR